MDTPGDSQQVSSHPLCSIPVGRAIILNLIYKPITSVLKTFQWLHTALMHNNQCTHGAVHQAPDYLSTSIHTLVICACAVFGCALFTEAFL